MKNSDNFFSTWAIYQAVIENNYMKHKDVIAALKTRAHDGLSILDLGCGDAYTAKEAFSNCEGVSYCGVDFSAAALDCAQRNICKTEWDFDFLTLDIRKALSTLQIRFDYIIAGYSLHHLDDDSKQLALHQIHRLLNREGRCILYDLLPNDREPAEHFIQRFLQDCDANWTQFNSEQLASIRAHVEEEDQPIDLQQWERMAREAGFNHIELNYRDPKQHYGVIEIY
ncbi:MAG: class I SAM-dependent methyltransferase [Opitutaceae bacterium]